VAERGRSIRTGNIRNILLAMLGVIICVPAAAFAQGDATPVATTAPAAFDVVSVKPVDPNNRMVMVGVRNTADGIQSQSVTLAMLVRAAYGGYMKLPTDDSVLGLPDWAKSAFFQVSAKMSDAQLADFAKLDKDAQEQRREEMLRSLLADRFQLKEHRETKQVPDLELVVAKGGPKLKEADTSNMKDPDGRPIQGSVIRLMGNGKLDAQNAGMAQLANLLIQSFLGGVGRRVADKTGLTGKYNFTLAWSSDPGMAPAPMGGLPPPPPPSGDNSAPSIFTALQEQLGLKLQASTGTFDVIVVDHVERPSDN
jgi:uncharacterized protein (TIGR03435 family)